MVNFKFLLSSKIKIKVFQYKNDFRMLGNQWTNADFLVLAGHRAGQEVCAVRMVMGPCSHGAQSRHV